MASRDTKHPTSSDVAIMSTSATGIDVAIQVALQLAARMRTRVVVIPTLSPEERVAGDHPLRRVRRSADDRLHDMRGQFRALYARVGVPSVPPERLLRATLLQVLFSIRSEHVLMEQLTYNLLFRWFVGLELDEPVWTPAAFASDRERLTNEPLIRDFVSRVVGDARDLLADERFAIDWAWLEGGTPSLPAGETR